MFEANDCTGHIFNFVSLAATVKSRMAAFEPLFLYKYLIRTIIENGYPPVLQSRQHAQLVMTNPDKSKKGCILGTDFLWVPRLFVYVW